MKINYHAKRGSLVLMIIILMTALVAIFHSLIRTTSYLLLLAREREAYERQIPD